jgi:hypothetical protein
MANLKTLHLFPLYNYVQQHEKKGGQNKAHIKVDCDLFFEEQQQRLFLMFTFVDCERDDLITHYGILSQFFSQHFTQNLLNLREKKSVCV